MKNNIYILIAAVLFTGVLHPGDAGDSQALGIDEGTHRFEFMGKPYAPVGSGFADVPDTLLDTLIEAGVNQFSMSVVPTKDTGIYNYKDKKSTNIKNNWGGFNGNYFDKLKKLAQKLRDKECTLFLIVFSTCARRADKSGAGRFEDHLWNIDNGGIFDPEKVNPVTEFYSFDARKYPDNKSAQEKLIVKVVEELKGYSNVGIVLQWEIFSGWQDARPWAKDMILYLKNDLGFRGLVGVGTDKASQLHQLGGDLGEKNQIFGLIEAVNIQLGCCEGDKIAPCDLPGDMPMIYVGYHPRKEGYNCYYKGEKICDILMPGQEEANFIASGKNMVYSLKTIAACSYPFKQYWYQLSSSLKKECKAPGIDDYRLDYVKNALLCLTSRYLDQARQKTGEDLDKFLAMIYNECHKK